MNITFHSDDYGICLEESLGILDCSDLADGEGLLSSLSIMPNSSYFPICADELDPYIDKLKIAVHINLTEGHCCCDPKDVPLLVDRYGYFDKSFFRITRIAKGEYAVPFKKQVKLEVRAQIEQVVRRFSHTRKHLRIDGHQHIQLIPVIFQSILEIVREGTYTLEYFRIPCEPASPFLACPSLFFTYKPINWVKHWVLNHYWRKDRKDFPEYKHKSAIFIGVLLSGKMDRARLEKILPHYISYARGRGMDLEVLLHPCVVEHANMCLAPKATGFVDFYLSPNRLVEAETLKTLDLKRVERII